MLCDKIGEPSIGSGRVSVVLHGETEVALFRVTWAFQNILAWPHKLNDCQRKIGKVIWVGSFTFDQKLVEGFGIWLGRELLTLFCREFNNPIPALRDLYN